MGTCLDQGIKVVSNAGASIPITAQRPSRRWLTRWASTRPSPTSTATTCCPRLGELREAGIDILDLETSEPVAPVDYISANAYLGAGGLSKRSTGALTSSSPAARPTLRLSLVRPPGITAGPAMTGTPWPAQWRPVMSSSAGRRRRAGTTPSSPRSPASNGPGSHRRDRGGRFVDHHQASRHRGSGHGRHGHVAAALRDRPAWLSRPRRHGTIRHDAAEPGGPDRVRISGTRGERPPDTSRSR